MLKGNLKSIAQTCSIRYSNFNGLFFTNFFIILPKKLSSTFVILINIPFQLILTISFSACHPFCQALTQLSLIPFKQSINITPSSSLFLCLGLFSRSLAQHWFGEFNILHLCKLEVFHWLLCHACFKIGYLLVKWIFCLVYELINWSQAYYLFPFLLSLHMNRNEVTRSSQDMMFVLNDASSA